MRRKVFMIMLGLLVAGVSAVAGNRLAKEGYVGNVSLSVTPVLGVGVDVITSHGYSFGNGLWMGGGAGVSFAGVYDGIFIPIFTETKYTFMKDRKASPFLDCKFGFMTNMDDIYLQCSPSFGVDINRFSVYGVYNIWSAVRTYGLGFAFNF